MKPILNLPLDTRPTESPDILEIVDARGAVLGPVYTEESRAIVHACNALPDVLETLRLIQRGLQQGSIRSKPIVIMDDNAEDFPMKSLNEIVEEAISKAERIQP